MKIRINGNSVRFRLTKSEVETLCKRGRVEERTVFADTTFTYAVIMRADVADLQAEFVRNSILLHLPEGMGKGWYENDRVGFSDEMDTHHGEKLSLLLEKDFVCLDNNREDQSDNYPNPKAMTPTRDGKGI